jgi:tetratricopeptide (TPR) repeat protein
VAALEPLARTAAAGPGYWEKLGETWLELHDSARAETAFQNAIRLDPKSAAARYGLGFLHQARGENAAAIEQYSRAAELDPGMAAAFANLAAAYLASGRREEAAAALSRALQLDPGELRWRKGLAEIRAPGKNARIK